jgi:hypothetical protein
LEEVVPFSMLEKIQDAFIDASESQFNRLQLNYVEELIKLSGVIMYKVKNSRFYKSAQN